ncbi:MAG: xylose isomerase [Chloroflexota bacterium]|nr:MAG: xylose isomerase [Chloroflexota bacterium]
MIGVANAPCSWGVLEFELGGSAAGFAQVLDEMRATDYAGTELGDWGFMPTDPARLRDELHARELQLLAAFVPINFSNAHDHAAGEATALRTARLLAVASDANPFIVLADENGKNPTRTKNAGRVTSEHALNAEEWRIFAEGVERVARAVRDETGLRSVFHHHCAGFVETPNEIAELMTRTNPELVGLCFDTGHYALGGGEPLTGLQKHFARVWHVHFKDFDSRIANAARENEWDYFDAVRHGIFCELGKGDVDFAGILNFLKAREYDGWIVVEQDVLPGMGTPRDSAQRNRAFLRALGV